MELPRIQRYGDVWTLVWDQQHVGIGFERVTETRDGITAQVIVESRMPEKQGRILGPVRLNLLSMQSQASFSKSLDARLTDVPWNDIVVLSCAIVVKQFTEPSPLVHLAEVDLDDAGIDYLLPGLVPLAETTFCYGDSESLKSTLAQLIGICVKLGAQLPWGVRPSQALRVLYCDWETNEVVLAERTARLAAGLGLPGRVDMLYRGTLRKRNVQPLRTLIDEVPSLREQIQREQIGLVIVDSIGFAVDGKLVDDDVARGAMSALRQLAPATRLVVAHISKESANKPNGRVDPFGSAFFRAGIRSGFEVRRSEQDEFDADASIGVYHWKSNDGAHVKPFGLKVSFDGRQGPIRFSRQDIGTVPDLAIRTSLASRLRQLLAGGESTIIELAEETGADTKVVDKTLRRMPDVQRLDHGGRGQPATWGLKA